MSKSCSAANRRLATIGVRWLWLFLLMLAAGPAEAIQHRPVVFDSQGARLHGIVVLPDCRPVAGIVLLHGSGPDGAQDYLGQAELFARGGVAALVYDKRGWNRSGGDWRHRPFRLLGNDAIAAARTLRAQPGVPAERVGYWGISQGGWVLAEAASRDPDAAFAIGVAATGISPARQELWHKEHMLRALGYSHRARRIAGDFWRLAFDFMVAVDRGQIPLPDVVLVNERAGASVGLDYDPLSAWSRVSAPVLLLYGTRDGLEPAALSIETIAGALRDGGHAAPQVRLFRGASHTITTRQTDLVFDWGEAFDPRYYPMMLDWIAAPAARSGPGLAQGPRPTQDDRIATRPISSFRGVAVQLPLLLFLPLVLLLSLGAAVIRSIRHGATLRTGLDMAVGLGGLALYAGFALFIVQSVYPQGTSLMPSYALPGWQRLLPVLGTALLVLALAALAQRLRGGPGRGPVGAVAAAMLIVWTLSWHLVGGPL